MNKLFWSCIALGALLLVLGAGNLLIGTDRVLHYRPLLQAEQISSSPAASGEKQVYQHSIRQRYDYYQFCVVAAKYFLALSGCFFLAALIVARMNMSHENEQAPGS